MKQKSESRTRILASAARGFRRHGFGGLGIDGLAKEAGVTSGAFYAHFRSKAEIFREAIGAGMAEFHDGISRARAHFGTRWVAGFVGVYLEERRRCDLGEGCVMQCLAGDIARADGAAKATFEAELQSIVASLAAGLDRPDAADATRDATALLALMVGGLSLARAVDDPALADQIIAAVRHAAEPLEITAPGS